MKILTEDANKLIVAIIVIFALAFFLITGMAAKHVLANQDRFRVVERSYKDYVQTSGSEMVNIVQVVEYKHVTCYDTHAKQNVALERCIEQTLTKAGIK